MKIGINKIILLLALLLLVSCTYFKDEQKDLVNHTQVCLEEKDLCFAEKDKLFESNKNISVALTKLTDGYNDMANKYSIAQYNFLYLNRTRCNVYSNKIDELQNELDDCYKSNNTDYKEDYDNCKDNLHDCEDDYDNETEQVNDLHDMLDDCD